MSSPTYQLAQINVARPLFPLDDERLTDLVMNLARIYELAESSPGFIWRSKEEGEDAAPITACPLLGPDYFYNLSVWDSVDSMHHFAMKTEHTKYMNRRREWFYTLPDSAMAMWWVEEGHHPDEAEGVGKLKQLWKHGASPDAFTFGKRFDAPQNQLAAL